LTSKLPSSPDDYVVLSKEKDREVRQYSFVLKNTEYSEMKIATHLQLNASTDLKLWLGKSGNVIGLDFVQVKETKRQ
jgi:hypothetical protein